MSDRCNCKPIGWYADDPYATCSFCDAREEDDWTSWALDEVERQIEMHECADLASLVAP